MNIIDLTQIDPDVYLWAAEHPDLNHDGACSIISEFAEGNEMDLFNEYFRPEISERAWWLDDDNGPTRQSEGHRVFALLFMHEIAKDLVKGGAA